VPGEGWIEGWIVAGDRPVRVFIVCAYDVIRRGLAELAITEPDIKLVGEASDARPALLRLERTAADVVLLDEQLSDGHALEACREIRSAHPALPCVLFTSSPQDDTALHTVLAGAAGHLPSQAAARELLDAARVVARGGTLLGPAMLEDVRSRVDAARGRLDLSPLQLAILDLVVEGLTNRGIELRLRLSADMVRIHVGVVIGQVERALAD
jgi:two-component system, NarL family, response regulator DevR